MRPRTLASGTLVLTWLFAACSGDQSLPTDVGPGTMSPLAASGTASLDPSHTYRFEFGCSSTSPNSMVSILTATNIPRIDVPCGSWTELGAAYGSPIGDFGYEIRLDAPDGKTCSETGVTKTGTFPCRSRKYKAALSVIDEGVITP